MTRSPRKTQNSVAVTVTYVRAANAMRLCTFGAATSERLADSRRR